MRSSFSRTLLSALGLLLGLVTLGNALASDGSVTGQAASALPRRAVAPLLAADSAPVAPETSAPTVTPSPTAVSTAHTWYTSSFGTAMYYFCDLDDGWKGLSPQYLQSYSTEQALLAEWAGQRVKHPQSKC